MAGTNLSLFDFPNILQTVNVTAIVRNMYSLFSKNNTIPLFLGILALYNTYCRALRHQRYLFLQQLCSDVLEEDKANEPSSPDRISSYYPKYWKIFSIISEIELNMEIVMSLRTRGLLSTYAIPTISTLLYSTGGFQTDTKRRYADMELILNEYGENEIDSIKPIAIKKKSVESTFFISSENPSAYESSETISYDDSTRSLRAIFRLNAIHGKYGNRILYQDMMYVLAVFATSPQVWADGKWGLRPFSELEKECCFRYFMHMGDLMNLHTRDQFSSYEDCLKYKRKYEETYMRYQKSNEIVTKSTLDYFLKSLEPAFIMQSKFVQDILLEIYSTYQESDAHRIALGLPIPRPIFTHIIDFYYIIRRFWVQNFEFPTRLSFRLRMTPNNGFPTQINHKSSDGYNDNIRSNENSKEKDNSVETSTRSQCPMMTMIYYPKEKLEHGNDTYTINYNLSWWYKIFGGKESKGYIIENMGPKEIEKGYLERYPKYAGVQTIHGLFEK